MSERITLPVLAERLTNHAEAFEAERRRAQAADKDFAGKLEKLGRDMNHGLIGVHRRVDAFHRCALRSIVGFAGAAIALLLSIVGYLLVNGAPWQ